MQISFIPLGNIYSFLFYISRIIDICVTTHAPIKRVKFVPYCRGKSPYNESVCFWQWKFVYSVLSRENDSLILWLDWVVSVFGNDSLLDDTDSILLLSLHIVCYVNFITFFDSIYSVLLLFFWCKTLHELYLAFFLPGTNLNPRQTALPFAKYRR